MFIKCALVLVLCGFIEADPLYYQMHTCRLPHIEHGRVRTRQRSKLVKFMCSNRYELVGNRYATCRNGHWDVPTPVCVRPGCPDLPMITNGVQIKAHHDAWVVNFCLPGYQLQGSSSMYCDGTHWNATVPKCVEDIVVTKPRLSCDFEEENICGWSQDELHDFDWKRLNTKTPSAFLFTGPSYDHIYGKGNFGYYMYIESTSRLENDTARIISPIYDASLADDGCFSFWYHMFGKDIGGLRVYQKPDSLQLHEMLNLTEADRGRYLLFDQWGNLGDTWFQAVPSLNQFNESFQIVIEGIRGSSFTSDIAIDDVAILQGENCTEAKRKVVIPTGVLTESCLGRCVYSLNQPATLNSCDCSPSCLSRGNCCSDFLELCIFEDPLAIDDDNSTTLPDLPQTQKLVSETTTTTKTITTTKPTTPTPKTTTVKRITIKLPTTPTIRSTSVATPTTTTPKPQPTTPKPQPTTTQAPKTTKTMKPTTTSTQKPTVNTTKKVATTSKMVATTTKKVVTPKRAIVTTAAPRVTKKDKMEEKKDEEKMTLQKMVMDAPTKERSSSTWKTAAITIVVLALLASLLYLGVMFRGSRGLVMLHRLRGQTTNDPEVRYLNSNDEDL